MRETNEPESGVKIDEVRGKWAALKADLIYSRENRARSTLYFVSSAITSAVVTSQ